MREKAFISSTRGLSAAGSTYANHDSEPCRWRGSPDAYRTPPRRAASDYRRAGPEPVGFHSENSGGDYTLAAEARCQHRRGPLAHRMGLQRAQRFKGLQLAGVR
jgi:hypothetical protein